MKLATQVLHPQRGNVLLRWGFELDTNVIKKLTDLGIHDVWVQYPGTDQIREFISPSVLQKRGEVVTLVAELFADIHKGAHAKLQFDQYSQILRELMEAILADGNASAYIVEMGGGAANELRHSAEVCFLSLLLGLKLQGYLVNQRRRLPPNEARNVGCLALGAMLHDVGYVTLDKDVRQRYVRTGDQTDTTWQSHVRAGYELVSGSIRPAAAGVIVQHHQHYDGSGFPQMVDDFGTRRGLVGAEIHVFARIVTVANQFDRLLNPGDGSPPPPRVRILRQMLTKPLASRYDPVVLTALPQVVPAYAPGSIVRLSNGEQVVVVKWHPWYPCQPLVQPLADDAFDKPRDAEDEAAPAYDLRQRRDLVIVEQDGHDVRQDNFQLSPGRNREWVSGAAPEAADASSGLA